MSSKERTPVNKKAKSNQGGLALATQSRNIPAQQIHPATIIQKARLDPRLLTPGDVLQLQRTMGNQAVGRLLAQKAQRQPIQKEENNTGLPDHLKAGIENLSGVSMDDVKVHYNSSNPARLQALAYTQGTDIYVGPEQETHLAHEAWHVVQQKQGRVRPTLQMKEVTINDDPALEREADVMGAQAAHAQDALQMQRDDFAAGLSQAQSSLSEMTTTSPLTQAVSMAGVVQRSTPEGEANQAAALDEQVAAAMLVFTRQEMETYRQTGQSILAGAELQSPFSDLPTFTGTALRLRRSFPITIDRGNGPETHRVPLGNLRAAIALCEQNHWPYHVHNLPNIEPEEDEGMIQMAATATGYGGGHMNENAAQPNVAPVPNVAMGTVQFPGVTARNTSLGADGSDLHDQNTSTGVGTTRPNQWVQFIAMAGAINPFKQGHQMHQDLDGDGTHDNLAPFTASLNALHYTRVESHVLNQTALAGQGQFADYSVTPTYAGNPAIVTWAQNQFAAMTPANQRAAMRNAGLMTMAVSNAYLLPAAPLLPAHLAAANLWLQNYVIAAFPTNIVCTATFIDDAGGGNYNGSNAQTVTITNDF
jgi:hypothetical protein